MKNGMFNRIATELNDPQKLTRAIEAQQTIRHRGTEKYVAPETLVQQLLAALWAEFLKLDAVGLDDNFFEIGGQSLMAMQIGFQIKDRFHVEFPLESFLTAPVLRAQAEQIQQMLLEQASEGELESLLEEIE